MISEDSVHHGEEIHILTRRRTTGTVLVFLFAGFFVSLFILSGLLAIDDTTRIQGEIFVNDIISGSDFKTTAYGIVCTAN